MSAALPSPGLLLAAAGGLIAAGAVTWLIARPSDAPALAPATHHLVAPASRLTVIDGETLRIGDDIIRLAGIVAPARDTLCRSRSGSDVDCGVAAANALATLVRIGPVDCAIHGRDARGRPIGDCQSAGVSISEALVRAGWARAQTANLKATEAAAKAANLGVWRNGDS
jgi:endonuclease YncB( thermonuclease family)